MPFRRRWAPSGTVTRGSSPVLGSLSARVTDAERQPFRSMGFELAWRVGKEDLGRYEQEVRPKDIPPRPP